MSFISVEFLIFALIFTPLYFVVPFKWRWLCLLLSSYLFYGWGQPQYCLLLMFTTVVDYFAGVGIQRTEDQRRRRLYLMLSLSVNFGLLFVFKYFNFFATSLGSLAGRADWLHLNVVLPIGISFYTFQSVAYTIDVYRRKLPAEQHFGTFATFVAFFPQLVAGPIQRAPQIIPQFYQHFVLDEGRVVSGLRLALWGAFKKMVIADRLAIYVNQVYNHTTEYTGVPLLLATLFFAFQIYCDFSGYTDIAIGFARVLGFNLVENFRQPYWSFSVREFWRRWHISLSTWFRDYLYIPLGGNRVSFGRNLFNLMVVFVVSGLWHGANWTFVIWGALHGSFIVIETIGARLPVSERLLKNIVYRGIRWVATLSVVWFAWIFFRANTFNDALYVIQHLFDFSGGLASVAQPFVAGVLPVRTELLVSMALIVVLMGVDGGMVFYKESLARWWSSRAVRWVCYYGLVGAVCFALVYASQSQQFIYFQF